MKPSSQSLLFAKSFSRIFSRKFYRSSKLSGENTIIIANIYNKNNRGSMDPRHRRVVVTGSGMISPLGCHLTEVFDKIMKNESGICKLESETFDYGKVGVHYAGKIPNSYVNECDEICKGDERMKSIAMKYAEFAAIRALEDAQWLPSNDYEKYRTGVCIGNSMTDLEFIASSNELVTNNKARRISPYFVPRILGNMAAALIAIRYGFRGPSHSVSTACSTGLHSIGDAYNFIKNNSADVMIAGGTDACINPLAISGFSQIRALSKKYKDSPTKASRPFDKDRDGFVMSEGAAVLVLEEYEHALERNANILCEVVGYGASCDANHITAGLEDGSGALLAIIGALSSVMPVAEDVTDELWLVNAHATSTPRGDAAEMNCLRDLLSLLQNELKEWNIQIPLEGPFVTAHKGNLGHMMSAAGSLESALACKSLETGLIPGLVNLEKPDSGISDELNLVKESIDLGISNVGRRRLVMKNSFGFGGTNACLFFAELK